ncbi:hypothetical protein H4R18_001620 [Coemansia javaensis]|uniref:Uncharacterized protein n=1 Tax=Coemansia javaensis TaxID=2761396 RepID=A0A9W8LKC2_9FUNG|nr:hypothetical protein H4R18_001620 [Coemansia javaensis]
MRFFECLVAIGLVGTAVAAAAAAGATKTTPTACRPAWEVVRTLGPLMDAFQYEHTAENVMLLAQRVSVHYGENTTDMGRIVHWIKYLEATLDLDFGDEAEQQMAEAISAANSNNVCSNNNNSNSTVEPARA